MESLYFKACVFTKLPQHCTEVIITVVQADFYNICSSGSSQGERVYVRITWKVFCKHKHWAYYVLRGGMYKGSCDDDFNGSHHYLNNLRLDLTYS